MNPTQSSHTIAVITSTIGRPELERTIQSVAAQTYPCTHYVFVDGKQYADAAREILARYPHVKAVYLPVNTGANGWYNSHINAAASFIAQEDIICFLDDDNWYREDHVASVVETFAQNHVDYVYTLRNLYNYQQEWICRDDLESLGKWQCKFAIERTTFTMSIFGETVTLQTPFIPTEYLIDINCFAMKRETAREIAATWCIRGFQNDVEIFKQLKLLNKSFCCTGKYTVNYLYDYHRNFNSIYQNILDLCHNEQEAKHITEQYMQRVIATHIQAYGGRPWAKE